MVADGFIKAEMRVPLGFNRMSTDRGIDTRAENAAGSRFYVTSNKYAIGIKREYCT